MKDLGYLYAGSSEMPCWYYEKKDLKVTPSIQEGQSFDMERCYRKEGARFIMTCGKSMGLGHNTVATGVVYFHRFYMFHSFQSFPRYVTACCCLFLAGKVEETPKKCRDIIKTARSLLADDQFSTFGDDPKEEVMTLERILLQTIKFDLQVEHPYGFLLKYAKCLKGEKAKLQKIVQMAWNFVNDSLSTTVCLQWEPEIIAVALMHLASKLSKFTFVDWVGKQAHHMKWWDMFVSDVTMDILEDICHQVLDLYQPNQANSSTTADSVGALSQSLSMSASPSNPKGPETPPQLTGGKSTANSSSGKVDDKIETNSTNLIPKVLQQQQQQPPPPMTTDAMHYMYQQNSYAMYGHGPPPPQLYHTPSIPGPPAPPIPQPMYGGQYQQSGHLPPPPAPQHYSSGPPPMMAGHRPPPQPPLPPPPPQQNLNVPSAGGYYPTPPSSYGRQQQRYPPPPPS